MVCELRVRGTSAAVVPKSARTIAAGGPIATARGGLSDASARSLLRRRIPGKAPPHKRNSRMTRSRPDTDMATFAARLERIAAALDRLAPPATAAPRFNAAEAFVWHPAGARLDPVNHVNRVDMSLLKGIDRVRDLLVENTERFARGLPANNALLWGARGMGKSSLVKAAHATVSAARDGKAPPLKLIEIHREEIESLPELMA